MKHCSVKSFNLYIGIGLFAFSALIGCSKTPEELNSEGTENCPNLVYEYDEPAGCDGQIYPDPRTSPYILPFESGIELPTGLANCSSSYHGPGQPDQYAFDFDLPEGTPFIASRPGKVVVVVESEPSEGGGSGNYAIIDHGDNTFGLYLHSPMNGITVNEGDEVFQGRELGAVGRSGLAGYPHLHFIVVEGGYSWPYSGIPISFNNVEPPDVVLRSFANYRVCK